MGKDYKDLTKHVEDLFEDGLLHDKEWNFYVHWANRRGFDNEEAERFLLEEATRRNARVERLELERLEDLVRIAAVDGVLDVATRDWLTPKCTDVAVTFSTSPPDVEAVRTRDDVEKEIATLLARRTGPSQILSPAEWQAFYHETLRALTLGEEGTDDFVDLFLACREKLGIMIQDGVRVSPPPPPPPEPPIPIRSIALLTTAVAVIVFFLILYVQSMME